MKFIRSCLDFGSGLQRNLTICGWKRKGHDFIAFVYVNVLHYVAMKNNLAFLLPKVHTPSTSPIAKFRTRNSKTHKPLRQKLVVFKGSMLQGYLANFVSSCTSAIGVAHELFYRSSYLFGLFIVSRFSIKQIWKPKALVVSFS